MIKKIILIPVCLVAMFVSHLSFSQDKVLANRSKHPVNVVLLHEYVLPKTVKGYGTVLAKNSVRITSQDSGIIRSISFIPGQKVHKGQLLLVFHTSDTANQLQQLGAAVQQARNHYDREKALSIASRGSISEAKLLDAKLAYQQAKAVYEAERKISYITSPMDGIISDTDIVAGEYVQAGTLLTTVTGMNQRQLNYQLPEQYIDQLKIGQKIRFAWHNLAYTAVVSYISPSLNADNLAITLKADIENGAGLPQNAFVQVTHILNPHRKCLALSQSFVQTDSRGFYFYSVAENKIVKHYFSPGPVTRNGLILVSSGAHNNTPVVISDPSSFTVGQQVRVVASGTKQDIDQSVPHKSWKKLPWNG